MSVGELSNREERPPYVRFERRPVEDKAASLREGRYVAKDVDFVLITPPYSKDCIEQKVDRWLENVDRDARDNRIPPKWAEIWREMLKRWRNGQEMPLHGTPILGWGVISPAQQQMLISINCMTVEDLAAVNDEGLKRIGMGGVDLKNKAKNWLASLNEHGPMTVKMAALEAENAQLSSTINGLQAQINALKALIPTAQQGQQVNQYSDSEHEITAADLLESEPASEPALEPTQRRGRPPKQHAENNISI